MAGKELYMNPPFRDMMQATGLAEVWTHTIEDAKFTQFGWRCTNNESNYETGTLIGNWSEERRDIELEKIPEPLPSKYAHYYNTIYNSVYNTDPKREVPEVLKHLKRKHPHGFPHHQPELDPPHLKAIYNSWETTMRASYMDPRARKSPIVPVGNQ